MQSAIGIRSGWCSQFAVEMRGDGTLSRQMARNPSRRGGARYAGNSKAIQAPLPTTLPQARLASDSIVKFVTLRREGGEQRLQSATGRRILMLSTAVAASKPVCRQRSLLVAPAREKSAVPQAERRAKKAAFAGSLAFKHLHRKRWAVPPARVEPRPPAHLKSQLSPCFFVSITQELTSHLLSTTHSASCSRYQTLSKGPTHRPPSRPGVSAVHPPRA
jgi:hypothetical protein